jgi:acylphosphatase
LEIHRYLNSTLAKMDSGSTNHQDKLLDSSNSMRVHLIITGKVQGVYFRQNMKIIAERNNVNGWVHNLAGGTVEAVLEGIKGDVEKVISWSSKGPQDANVTNVTVERHQYLGEFSSFEITYD